MTLLETARELLPLLGEDDDDFFPLEEFTTTWSAFLWLADAVLRGIGDVPPIVPTGWRFLTVADADIAAVVVTGTCTRPSTGNTLRLSSLPEALC
jgi:hypothetical protein